MREARERVEPVIQRVPARTRGALTVGVVAILALGLLIAKPWDARPVTPPKVAIVSPTTPAEVTASAPADSSPSPRTPGLTPRPQPSRTPERPPLSFPDTSPYTVELLPVSAVASCRYERAGAGARRLASIEVQPPVAYAAEDVGTGRVRSAVWSFEVLVNRAESVFDADWEAVAQSGREVAVAEDGLPATFSSQAVEFDSSAYGRTAVFRVRLIVLWYTLSLDPNETALIAPRYLEVTRKTIGPVVPYCAGTFA